ncbi:unnamed protein product, partial [Heterotrigona itama]
YSVDFYLSPIPAVYPKQREKFAGTIDNKSRKEEHFAFLPGQSRCPKKN